MYRFQQFFLICLTLLITACSVESITEEPSSEKEVSQELSSISKTPNHGNFSVTPAMLTKYLRLVCKGKQVEKVEPIVVNGDTLAYYVEFSNNFGWNLIAADTRVTPVLSEESSGCLLFEEAGSVNGILGTLKNVVDVKDDPEANVQAIWKFLCPELFSVRTKANSKGTRGLAEGMWIPVDTIFAFDTVFSGRTIATKWGQGYPWNSFTPKLFDSSDFSLKHAPVGCTAVAAGQILYRYLYLTNGLYNIPDSVNMDSNTPIFVTYTSDWSGFAETINNDNSASRNKTAKFLSWLGYNMNANYKLTGTHISISSAASFMDDYLQFSIIDSYDYNTAYSNVLSHIPVMMDCRNATSDTVHAFIIDACKEIKYQARVRYIFDPYHYVTEEEYYSHPSWMFEWPGAGSGYDPDKEDTWITIPIDIVDNTYFLMNWGWSGSFDNATYLVRSKHYYYNEDFSYLYYSTDDIMPISWKADGAKYTVVQHMLYGFRRLD